MLRMLRRAPVRAGLAITTVCSLAIGSAMAGGLPGRGKVVAVDKKTGRAAWEAPLWTHAGAAVPFLVTPELVYVLENGKTLKALDAATGRPRWQSPVTSSLPLTLAGETVIVVAGDTAIALNRWNGKRVWAFNPSRFYEWRLDQNTIPTVAPGRVLLPAGNTLIAIDTAAGQPAWAYTVTAARLPLQPVVLDGFVYLKESVDDREVRLSLVDGLPDTGEYALPPDVARAIARQRKQEPRPPAIARPASAGKKTPFVAVRAAVVPGGKALAAAGARKWRFPAPSGWTINRVVGESAGHLFALLGEAGSPSASPAPKKASMP